MSSNRETLLDIEDIGDVVADCVVEYFSTKNNLDEINKLLYSGINIVYENQAKTGIFSGEKVVLTGTLSQFKRDEASRIIEELGGEVLSSVSKRTTLVLAGENAGSKIDKAKQLGIKIINEETFKSLING